MRRAQALSVATSVDDASVGAHDVGAEVILMETGSTLTTKTASSHLVSYRSSSAQSRASSLRYLGPESTRDRSARSYVCSVLRQLQQPTASCVSTRPAARKAAHSWPAPRSGKSYQHHEK